MNAKDRETPSLITWDHTKAGKKDTKHSWMHYVTGVFKPAVHIQDSVQCAK